MYQFTTTEKNNDKASEYETKSMLYLFGCRDDSKDIDVFIIDCFNDVSGADREVEKLWDVQSKGIKSLNPSKIGISLITLFQNFISEIDFQHYILFMPKLKEMYLHEENKEFYKIDNFKSKHLIKVKQGLKKEFRRRNDVDPDDMQIDAFLEKVEFVIAADNKQNYIKKITNFKSSIFLEEEFYNSVFEDIRNQQTILKLKNIDGYHIMSAREVLQYEKVLWKKDIDALVINRMLGMDLFNSRLVPNMFIDEIVYMDNEERKDIIQECQSNIARVLFNKSGRIIFWNFFGKLLDYSGIIRTENPRIVLENINKDGITIPRMLDEMSVIYLVSALKEGMSDDN